MLSFANLLCIVLPCELVGQWYPQLAQQPFAPSTLPQSSFAHLSTNVLDNTGVHKVAIIGAGAGGSSAAFWISRAQEHNDLSISIDIFESASYIGGRSTVVYPYDSTDYEPAELGASIFVTANRNMMRAAKEFNLTLLKFDEDSGETGVWDGKQFLIKIGGSWLTSWWNKLQIIWRYGIKAPSRTQKLVGKMIDSFLSLYTHDTPKWNNVQELADTLGLSMALNQTTSDYLGLHDVDPRWTREIVEAATRVNYAQNVDTIHALGGMVSMAANGAFGVKGGNFQIFQHFINASKAYLHLNSKVNRLEHITSQWLIDTPGGVKLYDTVILAAPLTSELPVIPRPEIVPVKYVNLHVTLLTTSSPHPNSTYFARDSRPPTSILTSYEGVRNGGKEPPFNSLSYHGKIAPDKDEWVVKVFSESKLSKKWLNKIFNNRVGWVYQKLWKSYPVLTPSVKFSDVRLADGLYYVNAFESFISTMETETVASRNVVDLFLKDKFNTTICGSTKTATINDDYVYGWDC